MPPILICIWKRFLTVKPCEPTQLKSFAVNISTHCRAEHHLDADFGHWWSKLLNCYWGDNFILMSAAQIKIRLKMLGADREGKMPFLLVELDMKWYHIYLNSFFPCRASSGNTTSTLFLILFLRWFWGPKGSTLKKFVWFSPVYTLGDSLRSVAIFFLSTFESKLWNPG